MVGGKNEHESSAHEYAAAVERLSTQENIQALQAFLKAIDPKGNIGTHILKRLTEDSNQAPTSIMVPHQREKMNPHLMQGTMESTNLTERTTRVRMTITGLPDGVYGFAVTLNKIRGKELSAFETPRDEARVKDGSVTLERTVIDTDTALAEEITAHITVDYDGDIIGGLSFSQKNPSKEVIYRAKPVLEPKPRKAEQSPVESKPEKRRAKKEVEAHSPMEVGVAVKKIGEFDSIVTLTLTGLPDGEHTVSGLFERVREDKNKDQSKASYPLSRRTIFVENGKAVIERKLRDVTKKAFTNWTVFLSVETPEGETKRITVIHPTQEIEAEDALAQIEAAVVS
jgi:hypothetical protein